TPGAVFRPTILFNGSGILLRREDDRAAALRFHQGLFVVEDREFLRRLADLGPIAISADPMIITRRRPDGSNLTGGRHLRRRIRGHVLLLRKYLDRDSAPWLRAQTMWLLNPAAKTGVDAGHWRILSQAAHNAGWRVPLKAWVRRALRAP